METDKGHSTPQKRKALVAREDLVNALSLIARKRGSTLYAITNEVLECALKADLMGTSLSEVLEIYEILKINKNAGHTLVPLDVLTVMIERLSRDAEALKAVEEVWKDAGRWYGGYLSIRLKEGFKNEESTLKGLERILRELRWEFAELVITKDVENAVRIRCVAPQLPLNIMRMLADYIEGVFEAFGYKCVRKDVFKGIIDLVLTHSYPAPRT